MAVNLRTKPIDRRRLSAQDKSDYNMVRSRKIAGARARRGANVAQRQNTPIAHTVSVLVPVALLQGLCSQQSRNREEGAKVRRSEALRPTKDMSQYEIYQ